MGLVIHEKELEVRLKRIVDRFVRHERGMGSASTYSPRGAGEIAETIDRRSHSLIEGRHVECGIKVSQMVLDIMKGAIKPIVWKTCSK